MEAIRGLARADVWGVRCLALVLCALGLGLPAAALAPVFSDAGKVVKYEVDVATGTVSAVWFDDDGDGEADEMGTINNANPGLDREVREAFARGTVICYTVNGHGELVGWITGGC